MRLSRSISYLSFCSLDGGIGGGNGGGGIQEWEIGFDVGGERERARERGEWMEMGRG